jgi:autotransporter-associated beta strand protein
VDFTANWLQSGTNQFFFAGDSVTFDDTGSDSPAINISANVSPASVTVNASQSYDLSGAAIVTGKLIKNNTGTLILENNNTYNGPTVIGGGTLQVGGSVNSGAVGALGTGPVTNNGALVFDLATNYSITTNIFGTGNITNIGASGTVTLSGSVNGGSVYMAGTGIMVLSGSNSYTGQTIVSSGSLRPENSHALGAGTASTIVSNGAQLYIDVSSTITNKPLSLAGTGLTGDGALRAGGGGATTFGGVITLVTNAQISVDGGATLNLTNAAGINAPGINLIIAGGGVGNIPGPLTLGAGSVTVGGGTWNIAATNTYTGDTIINGGTLIIPAKTALGPVSTFTPAYVQLNGGSLGVTNNITFADSLGGFTANGGFGGFNVGAGATLTISNQISGTGTIIKSGPGTLILSGSNTFTGILNIDTGGNAVNDGVLEITTSNAIAGVQTPIAIRNLTGGASTFELNCTNGNILVTQDITLNGRSPSIPAILNAAGTNTLAGNFTGGNGGPKYVIESDSGLLTLGSSGTLLTFTTADPQTITFQGNGSFSVAGVISDGVAATGVEKDGNGSLTLNTVNTYTGSTLVNAGTLTGTGTISGPVNVNAGGTLSPGTPLGTLTINNTLSLAGSTSIAVNKTLATSSQVAGLTGATYGGTLVVSNLSGTLVSGDSFQVFPATTFSGNFSSISPAPGSGLSWKFNPTNGILSVVTGGIPTTPTNITFSVSGGNMTLNWPQSYTGWILQAQTNSLAVGISTNWVNVASSVTTNSVTMPINPANPTVFFRLRSP